MGKKTNASLQHLDLWKSHSKSSRIRRLQCENGLFLEVLCDGSLRGSRHGTGEYGVFHLYSIGPNLVAIRSIITGLFVSVDKSVVTTKEHFSHDCLFEEGLSCRFYVFYKSKDDDINEESVLYVNDVGELSLKNAKSSVLHQPQSGILNQPLSGAQFKTLLLPEDEFLHFFCMGRSLDW